MQTMLDAQRTINAAKKRLGVTVVCADNMPPEMRHRIRGKTIYVNGNLTPDAYTTALLDALEEFDGENVVRMHGHRKPPKRQVGTLSALLAAVAASALLATTTPSGWLPDTTGWDSPTVAAPERDQPAGGVVVREVAGVTADATTSVAARSVVSEASRPVLDRVQVQAQLRRAVELRKSVIAAVQRQAAEHRVKAAASRLPAADLSPAPAEPPRPALHRLLPGVVADLLS